MSSTGVALVGQDYWVARLVPGLRNVGVNALGVRTTGLGLSDAWRELRNLRRAQVVVRVGFRPGAKTKRGLLFDVVMKVTVPRRSSVSCYWIGSDVVHHREQCEREVKVSHWRDVSRLPNHIAGSETLARELKEAGITAQVLPFPWVPPKVPQPLPPIPDHFTVVTYVPDDRSHFYGGSLVLEVARRFPHAVFEIMGSRGGSWAAQAPLNVSFLGWVNDPAEVYSRSSCVLRLPIHDSVGGTAVEGLLFGRPVLYTGELAHTIRVKRDVDEICSVLERLMLESDRSQLAPDDSVSRWAQQEFHPERRFALLAGYLNQLARTGRGGD